MKRIVTIVHISRIILITGLVMVVAGGSLWAKGKKTGDDILKRDKSRKEKIIQTLDYGIQKERLEAITMIDAIKTKSIRQEIYQHLVKSLENELDTRILIKGISTLAEADYSSAKNMFIKHLEHRSDDVKIAAIYGIKSLKAVGASKKLGEMLKKQDFQKNSSLIEALLRTLGELKAKDMSSFAREKIKEATTATINREHLVLFLGKAGDNKSIDLLLKLFEDEAESVTIRSYSVNSLSSLKVRKAVPAIKKEIERIEAYPFKKKQKFHSLYMYCIAALVNFGDSEAYSRLMDSMRSNNVGIRRRAASLLSELGDKRSIDILKYKMKYDPDKKVQKISREALKKMGVNVDEEKK